MLIKLNDAHFLSKKKERTKEHFKPLTQSLLFLVMVVYLA